MAYGNNRVEARGGWQGVLRWGFGLLWIIAGLLKLQPGMFSSALIVNVLGPNALTDQPAWLMHLMMGGVHLWHSLLPVDTILLALWEIALGVGLIFARGRWFRVTLWVVIIWSAVVWVMAEGMGGVLNGSPTLVEDSPGSSPFYAMAALLLLYPQWAKSSVLTRAAGAFWALAALIQCLPYNWSAASTGGMIGNVTMNGQEPAWVDRLNNAFILMAFHHAVVFNIVMVLVMAVLAWGYASRRISGFVWFLTIIWLAFLWIVPEDFATLFSGTATDLGNPIPLALLLWTVKYSVSSRLPTAAAHSAEDARPMTR